MTDQLALEHRIECAVERMIDGIDREYMRDGNAWTETEYKARIKRVDEWANEQYRATASPS